MIGWRDACAPSPTRSTSDSPCTLCFLSASNAENASFVNRSGRNCRPIPWANACPCSSLQESKTMRFENLGIKMLAWVLACPRNLLIP